MEMPKKEHCDHEANENFVQKSKMSNEDKKVKFSGMHGWIANVDSTAVFSFF